MREPRIGVISNAHSKRNKVSMRQFHALLAAHPQVLHRSFDLIGQLPSCMAEMAAAEVTHLVISGGDGTVLAAITHLVNESPFTVPPCLSLLSAGNANAIGHAVGQPGLPAAGLKRIVLEVEAGSSGVSIDQPVLSVDFGDGRPIERGFLLGGVGFYQGTQLVRRDIHALGAKHTFATKLGIAWSIAKILILGLGEKSGFTAERIGFLMDGRPDRRNCLMFICSTLRTLLPGVKPFWGEGDGRLQLTMIDAPPVRFAAAALSVIRGRPRPWMEPAGYLSRRLERLELEIHSPVMIDGERFDPPEDGRVIVSAGPVVRFHKF